MRISDLKDPVFTGGGVFSSEGSWIHGKRVLDSFELMLVTRGEVYIREGNTECCLQPGEYIVLRAGIPHEGWKVTERKTEFYWLHFLAKGELDSLYRGMARNLGVLIQSARQLLQIWEDGSYPEGTQDAMLRVLLAELDVQHEEKHGGAALAIQTREFIRSHSRGPLTAGEIADAMGYSTDHLSRVLKRSYGQTLGQTIAQERMNRARLLLQTTQMNIAQVAQELGWEDANLFEKFFRYHQKCTPNAYRKSFTKYHTNHR